MMAIDDFSEDRLDLICASDISSDDKSCLHFGLSLLVVAGKPGAPASR